MFWKTRSELKALTSMQICFRIGENVNHSDIHMDLKYIINLNLNKTKEKFEMQSFSDIVQI